MHERMLQSGDGSQEDAALLLAIKDAEISTLRQQMAHLADDLKRNLAVLATKDEDALKLRSTVDGLRTLLAEKDNLFSQFQAHVQELELLRVQESGQRLATEQLLASKQKEWAQQLETVQHGTEAEVAALQQQLKESEERYLEQLMQARQTALDESMQRSTQQQSALDREAEHVQRLQQQLDVLGSALAVKEAELEASHRQLAAALEATQKMEAAHAKTVAAKDVLIAQLQRQLDQQASSIAASTGEHESNMAKLIGSLNEMQHSCQTQASEVQEYATTQKRLQEERRVLREQMRQMEATVTKLQTEKGVLEAALQHEVMAQAGAQAQLNIFQAKLSEAVVELEKRCAAAESRSSKLMAQLVEERGRLVDAVIEQANSSTPQLAAELAKSLEADRLRTQAELQVAQERSRSLTEELSLIRSTLLPLLLAPAATAAAAAGVVPTAQPANGSMAALAQMMQQQQAGFAVAPGSPLASAAACAGAQAQISSSRGDTGGRDTPHTIPFSGAAVPTASSPGASQYESPARAGRIAEPAVNSTHVVHSSSPTALSPGQRVLQQYCTSSSQQRESMMPRRGSGGLAGLVSELQSDVDKLQQQLHSTRRQLKWEGQQDGADSKDAGAGVADVLRHIRPFSSADGHRLRHRSSNNSSSSPAQRHQEQQGVPSPSHRTLLRHSCRLAAAAAASPGSAGGGEGPRNPSEELHHALKYLLNRTEQLSVENGALRMQLLEQDPPPSQHHSHKLSSSAGALNTGRAKLHTPHQHLQQNGSPCSKSSKGSGSPHHSKAAAHNYRRAAAAAAAGADCGSDMEGGEAGSQFGGSSGTLAGGASLADRDDLSSAASDELAAAQAAVAAECSGRRRQRRTVAAAAAWRGSTYSYNTQHSSSSRNVLNVLQRSSSLESRQTALSDFSSCSTLSPGPEDHAAEAGYSRGSRTGAAASCSSMAPKASNGGSSSRQLLESVLASYPNNHLGRLIEELTAGNAGTSETALAAAAVGCRAGGERVCASTGRSSSSSSGGATGGVNAALAREQLRRVAQLSPGRQRL